MLVILWLLFLYANSCNALWRPMWYYAVEKNYALIILNLTSELIKDTDERIAGLEWVRQGALRSAQYEIGYLAYQIYEDYRKMVDIFNTSYGKQAHFYPMELVIFLEDIEHHYWQIEHLCNMQHEIERKWRIFSDPNEFQGVQYTTTRLRYVRTTARPITFQVTTTTERIRLLETTTKKSKGYKMPKTRKKKGQKILKIIMDRAHSTKKRSTRWWWPMDYGWEIESYW